MIKYAITLTSYMETVVNKFSILTFMRKNGDSFLALNAEDDIMATTDFSTKYIRDKKYGRFVIKKNQILVFSWTDDKFRNLEVDTIRGVKSLSSVLRNVRDPDIKGISNGR